MWLSPAAIMILPLWQGLAWSFPATPAPVVAHWTLRGSHDNLPGPGLCCVLRNDGCLFLSIFFHSAVWENSLPYAHRPSPQVKKLTESQREQILLELNSVEDTESLTPTNQPTNTACYQIRGRFSYVQYVLSEDGGPKGTSAHLELQATCVLVTALHSCQCWRNAGRSRQLGEGRHSSVS